MTGVPLGSDADRPEPGRTTVLLSWAHGDAEHERQVIQLATQLRLSGIDADVDLYHREEPGIDWTRWGPNRIDEVAFVLLIGSRAYTERWEGRNDPRVGAGAVQEADKLRGLFQRDQAEFQGRVVVVLLPGTDESDALPDELRRLIRFRLKGFSESDLEGLIRTLTNQPSYAPVPLGPLPRFAPEAPATQPNAESISLLLAERDQLRDELRDIAASLGSLPPPQAGDGPHLPWYRRWEELQTRAAFARSGIEQIERSISQLAFDSGRRESDSTTAAQRSGPRPAIVMTGVDEFMRTARGSRAPGERDLQVLFARVRNDGDADAEDGEIWMEAFDVSGQLVGSAKGNWLDLSAGEPPQAAPQIKMRTLRPTREEHGVEVSGKFVWGSDAWIAGEMDPPSLPPGVYRLSASLSFRDGYARVLEWQVTNPGAGAKLRAAVRGPDGTVARTDVST